MRRSFLWNLEFSWFEPAWTPDTQERRALSLAQMEEGNSGDTEKFAGELIRGKVLIPADVPAFTGATAHVRLEELSGEDDKGAALKAETTIPRLSHQPSDDPAQDTLVDFEINVAPGSFTINPKNEYAVRVWIDHDSDGKRGPGDCYSDERHRVLTGSSVAPLVIKVVQR